MSYIRDFIQAPSSIKYLQGASNYSWLYFQDGQKMLIAKPLCYFEERLPDFLRIHKMIIVNPLYIEEFTAPPRSKMAGAVQLQGGVVLPVSRRRWLVVADQLAALPARRVLAANAVMPVLTESLSASVSDIQPLHRHNHSLFVTMTDPFRVRLLRQLIADQWPDWEVHLFDTASRLKKALQTTAESELPALILLEDNHQNNDSLAALQFIKDSLQFRRIPTLLLATFGNQQLTEDGYASGANSVIVQPADATQSVPVFEKIFRYWLHMAAASRATSRRAA